MARELGLNPKKLGKIDNHRQEPWKQPLPRFIEDLRARRFGRERPEVVVPVEERARQAARRKTPEGWGAHAGQADVTPRDCVAE